MIGRVISGRYVVEAVVGTGGMAVVYRAYDKVLKKTVAVKVLRPEYESDGEFVRRFSREAVAASKVSHENIVNMFDVGMDGDIRYIVMEYVDGQTLKEMIRANGRINPDQALRMTIRILAAVDHAHRNGIVHRDIKPQNILVNRHGSVKVADFGIARLKASQTTRIDDGTSSALGSVHYFSPEQARGEVADEKSDLYSVGIVMYEMLTGQVPFDGETAVSVALKHVSEHPQSMRQVQNGISKALDEVVMRALCKDIARRYQTAAEMAADLRKTITHPKGGFVKYPLVGEELERVREQRRKKIQRNKRRLVYGGVAVAVMVSLVAMVLMGWYFLVVRRSVFVPDVIGQEQLLAQDALESAGLPVAVETAYSEEYEEGIVIGQSRKALERVQKGSGVVITVSAGTQWYYMENLVGLSEEQAMEQLNANRVEAVVVEYIKSDREIGSVVAQSVDTGWQSKDQPVVLTVSGQSVFMPDLVGLSLEGATALIEAEGLSLGTVTEGYSADAVPHTVISQSILPEEQVLAGTVIDMTVSQRAETKYMPQSAFTVVVPLENLSVEVTLTTPSGEEVLFFSDVMSPGTHPVELVSGEMGMHIVRVYLDGVLMEATEVMFD
ncbi:MAG: protein kinase [Christensenellales bacterium]|nr:protein kinase [Christensenellales bacterium]